MGDEGHAQDRQNNVDALTRQTNAVARAHPSFYVGEAGAASSSKTLNKLFSSQLGNAGMRSLPLTLVILALVFGSLVAGLVPRSARLRRRISWCAKAAASGRGVTATLLERRKTMTNSQRQTAPAPSSRRRFAVAAILACLGAAVIAAPSTVANPAARDRPNLQKDLDALVAGGAPGAVLLVRNQNHTVRYTAGLADVRNKRPMRAVDRFRIASLTKTYTATVVLQLVAEDGFTSTTASSSTCRGSSRTAARSRSASCSTTRAGCLTTSVTTTS